jgi:hypothetical protein
LRGCMGCNGQLGGLGDDMTTYNVTAQRLPCSDVYRAYYNNPTLLGEIEYNLCLAAHKMGSYALDAGHWLWNELDGLWTELESLWTATERAGGQALDWIGQKTQNLWTATKNFLGDLDEALTNFANNLWDELTGTGSWLLWAGGIVALVMLAPAINDAFSVGKSEYHHQRAKHE